MPKPTRVINLLRSLPIGLLLLVSTTLAHAAAEIEPNNTSGQANTLTSGVMMSGNLFDDTDEDYFRINVGSSGTLTVQATSTNYASLQVLNPSLEVVGGVDYLNSGTKTVSVGVGASGYYYVRLFDSGSIYFDTDPYELTVTHNAQGSGAEVELNNSTNQANALTSGVTMSGHLYDDADEDYFRINVGSSGTLTVQATSTNYASLQVLNPSLEVVGGVDYLNSGTKTVSVGVGASGYYYVRLFDSGSIYFDTDPYELTVTHNAQGSGAEVELNNSTNQANALTSGVTMSGHLYDDADEDYFRINVGSSGTLTVQATSTNYASLQVLNPSLEVVGGVDYLNSGTKTVSVGVGASGYYYVRLFDSGSIYFDTDPYELTVTHNAQGSGAEVELNNSTNQANALTSGVTMSGHLYDDADEDYFRINVGSSGTLTVQATSTNYASLQVLNPSLEVVGGVDYLNSGTKTVSVGVGASGYYYVRLFDSGSIYFDTDPYELTATYDGDAPAKPTLSLVSKTSTSASLSMSSNGDGSSPVTQWDASCEIPSLASQRSREMIGSKVISLGQLTDSQPKARNLNTSERTTAASQAKVYLANPELRNAEVGDTLLFAASDGSEISLLIESVLETSQGNLQIVGNSPTATALAVVNLAGEFFASVETETAEFRSVILGGETLVYSSLDGGISDLPVLHDMDLEALAMRAEVGRDGGESPPPTGALSGSTTVVTVGALYDNLLRDNVDTAAMVDFYVGKANLSYQNSGVDIQFDVVATANYEPYKDTSDLSPTLNWITCGTASCNPMDGVNASVNNWRDSVKADVVLQFLAYGSTDFLTYVGWGIAQLPFNSSDITNPAQLKQHTYSVNGVFNPIDGSVGPSGLVAHEMGHNFGLFHDRDTLSTQGWTGSPAPVYDYAFGHRFGPSYGSVMSYAANPVEFLSNPSYSYSGYPTGVAIGQSGQAHSAQAVANVMGYHAAIYSNAPVVYHAVTVSNGAGGSVSPASASVREGATTSFTLTPDSGYAIGSVSGCGGSLSGNIYTTGAVYTPCSISVSFHRYQWTESTSGSAVTFSGLPSGYTYGCSTVATNLAGSSPASDTLSFTLVPPSTPSVPVNVRADSGDEEIYLYFTAGDDGGSPVTQFTATCTDGTNSFVASSGSSPIIVTELTNDTPYTCRVTATNGVGASPATAPTPPIVPEETAVGLPIWLLYQATQ